MRIVSTTFLVGFAALTSTGAALAQAPSDPLAGMQTNSLSSSAASLGSQPTSAAKLNAGPSELGAIANAMSQSPAARIASLKEAGIAGGENVAKIKLGAPGGQAGGSDLSSLSSMGVAPGGLSNSLSESGIAASGGSASNDMKAATMLGIGTGSLSNSLGDQRMMATQRLGGK